MGRTKPLWRNSSSSCVYQTTEPHAWRTRAEATEAELEASRSFSQCFIHIDMDMIYAAVEKVDPSLRERPFAVGSYAMLVTSNYMAHVYGVCSGMPEFIAKKLCPTLQIHQPRFDLYLRQSAAVRAIWRSIRSPLRHGRVGRADDG